jgi:hypothetical protein
MHSQATNHIVKPIIIIFISYIYSISSWHVNIATCAVLVDAAYKLESTLILCAKCKLSMAVSNWAVFLCSCVLRVVVLLFRATRYWSTGLLWGAKC